MTDADTSHLVRVGSLDELKAKGCLVVSAGRHGVAVFWHEGRAWAVDNRCPHMGFPLSRGTVREGLLTCHWHHARFDLASGGTLDPFAGDVQPYATLIRGGDVFVEVAPAGERTAQWHRRLEQGLEDQLPLALAKATLALLGAGAEPREILRVGALFGARYRAAGWGPGLSILTAMANVLPWLGPDERPLALFHGVVRVAEDCAGRPPRFGLDPLPAAGHAPARLKAWFRDAVEVRDAESAERVLRTAIDVAPPAAVADLLFAAVTDHYFLDAGHTLDFVVKALELLDQLGWSEAAAILPSLVGGLCRAERSEERSAWRRPIDLPALVQPAVEELQSGLEGDGSGGSPLRPGEFDELVTILLVGEEPGTVIDALVAALRRGTALADLGQAVAHASSLRIARFPTSNEFGDWDTVHNTFSSCNALHQALRRAPSPELARGLLHAAMKIYLDRFLNVPPARLPDEEQPGAAPPAPPDGADAPAALLELLDREQQVTPAGRLVDAYLRSGRDERPMLESLGRAVLREDAGFHDYQALEGAFRQYALLKAARPAAARRALVALARFGAAHSPTSRALRQTYQIALRLHRGEELFQPSE